MAPHRRKTLVQINRQTAVRKIRLAMYHLAHCWDDLRKAEGLTGYEIETDHIEELVGEIGEPAEAFGIDDKDILEILKSCKRRA